MAKFILRADEGREQHNISCYFHALSVLQEARAQGFDWIRVEKPGHACEFMVAALVEQVRTNPRSAPKCLVNLSRPETERLGTWYEPRTHNWPGADLSRRLAER